jgi:hypothetical protein
MEETMIKFLDDKIVYTKTIKTNKHKKLLLHFTIENDFYFQQAKQKLDFWKRHVQEVCCDKQFKNNIVTENYFT